MTDSTFSDYDEPQAQTNQNTTSVEDTLAIISDKWSIEVLRSIRAGNNRHGQLLRAIPEITKKMLAQTLRKLQRNGILNRIDFDEKPPRVEYEITKLGDSLIAQLTSMCEWSQQNFAAVEEARNNYQN